jgi:hypothetical protein
MNIGKPTHRLMLFYRIDNTRQDSYYSFIVGDFIPSLHKLDLPMIYAWQVFGDVQYERQLDFICQSEDVIRKALKDWRFIRVENRLKSYTTLYRRKVVIFDNRYQL